MADWRARNEGRFGALAPMEATASRAMMVQAAIGLVERLAASVLGSLVEGEHVGFKLLGWEAGLVLVLEGPAGLLVLCIVIDPSPGGGGAAQPPVLHAAGVGNPVEQFALLLDGLDVYGRLDRGSNQYL